MDEGETPSAVSAIADDIDDDGKWDSEALSDSMT